MGSEDGLPSAAGLVVNRLMPVGKFPGLTEFFTVEDDISQPDYYRRVPFFDT